MVIWTAIEAFHNVHNEPVLAVNHRCGISGNQRFYNVRARKHLLTANLSFHVVSMLTTWKLRLAPSPLRTTPLAEAVTPETAATVVAGPTLPQVHALEASAPELVGQWARAARPGLFEGLDFTPQENGTLRCPAGQSLWERERRPQADGSLRISYAARRGSGRACALRAQCLRGEPTQALGRKVSVVVGRTPAPASPAAAPLCAPLAVGTQPVLWRDWERRAGRRAWMGNIHQAKKGRGKEKQRKTRFR